ncbi:hypothetical protein T439DRAFT_323751 [Meredithblackwellia eburnea MCA 4105]
MSFISTASKRVGRIPPSSARQFAVSMSSAQTASNVSKAADLGIQATVAGLLLISTSYLVAHPAGLDNAAPRSGMLHYIDHPRSYSTYTRSPSTPSSSSTSSADDIRRSSPVVASRLEWESNRELRLASVLAKALRGDS